MFVQEIQIFSYWGPKEEIFSWWKSKLCRKQEGKDTFLIIDCKDHLWFYLGNKNMYNCEKMCLFRLRSRLLVILQKNPRNLLPKGKKMMSKLHLGKIWANS